MKKIILTTLLACTTTVMAGHETISSEFTKKFVETKPTVNLNHYSDSMVARVQRCSNQNPTTTFIDCRDTSRRCYVRFGCNDRCGDGVWRTNVLDCPF